MIKKLFKILVSVFVFLTARVISLFLYDDKYLKSKFFLGKYFGVFSQGWRWVIADFWGRLFYSVNLGIPWPVSPKISIGDYRNVKFDINDLNNFQSSGCYFQAIGAEISIGTGTYIGPNVGIITANHNINDLSKSAPGKAVKIGENCWIGMNTVILPGVCLGDNTIVGAGAIVTKSFKEGKCVIAGNPAKIVKKFEA